MADEFVGAPDAASRLGLTSERIRQLAKAGELPPPAGRVGRQDVWRWQELLDWAVAQGRLDAAAGGQRQRVRAWAPGQGRRRRVVDEVLDWDDGRSYAHVRIWEPADDAEEPAVVVIGNLEDSRGQSATNRIEDVAMLVAARYLGPSGLQAQYYDHWSRSAHHGASFDHVTFSVDPVAGARSGRGRGVDRASVQALGGVFVSPKWRETTAAEVEKLVGERVEVYTAGTYTAAMVRAARQSDDGVDAVWDPDGALQAARAYERLHAASAGDPAGLSSHLETARHLLALHVVRGLEKAAADLAWQDPDAPVRLHLPALPQAGELRKAAAGSRRSVPHEDAWAVAGAARERLASIDTNERLLLVSAVGGGLSRLAWWEAGLDEPRDERYGMSGRIVVEADLLTDEPDTGPPTDADLLRAIERAALEFLERECDALDRWDVPAVRPAGPFPASAPTARIYLDQVAWATVAADDRHREQRLRHLLETRGGGRSRSRRAVPKAGLDPGGRMVVLSGDGRTFCLEWPVGSAGELTCLGPGLLLATVKADAGRARGAQPVWVEVDGGPVVPLPSGAGWTSAHDYTWGYSGTGPANLAAALTGLVAQAADIQQEDVTTSLGEVMRELARSGRTPAWRVDELLHTAAAATR